MDQELDIAIATGDGRDHDTHDGCSGVRQRIRGLIERSSPHLAIANHSSSPVGLGFPGLELRFHEGDEFSMGRSECQELGGHRPQRNEREIDDDEISGATKRSHIGMTDIRPLVTLDPLVGP
jgi:hypothetical protein